MPKNKLKKELLQKRQRAHSQLNPTISEMAADIPNARHRLMAARLREEHQPSRKGQEELIEAEKDFLSRMNMAKKRKTRKL